MDQALVPDRELVLVPAPVLELGQALVPGQGLGQALAQGLELVPVLAPELGLDQGLELVLGPVLDQESGPESDQELDQVPGRGLALVLVQDPELGQELVQVQAQPPRQGIWSSIPHYPRCQQRQRSTHCHLSAQKGQQTGSTCFPNYCQTKPDSFS